MIPAVLATAAAYYLAILGLVCVWLFYKLTTSRQKIEAAKLQQESSGFVEDCCVAPKCVIVLVHGTWAIDSGWNKQGSSFRNSLASALGERGAVKYERFLWLGGNSLIDRDAAIGELRLTLNRLLRQNPEIPHFILAHSHGGNVALKAILDEGVDSDKIAGICCVATPFILNFPQLVATESTVSQWCARASRILAVSLPAAVSTYLVLSVVLDRNNDTYAYVLTGAVLLVVAVVLLMGRKFSALTIETTIDHRGVRPEVFNKLLTIRASGDEASAALGAAFIIRFALLTAWSATLGRLTQTLTPVHEKNWGNVRKRFDFGILVATSILLALAYIRLCEPYFYVRHGIPFLPDTDNIGIVVFSLAGVPLAIHYTLLFADIIFGVSAVVLEIVTWIFYIPVDFIAGFLLLPFAPELILTTAMTGLSAEATVPQAGSSMASTLHQLSFQGRRALNHSAYEHPETVGIIAKWIQGKMKSAS